MPGKDKSKDLTPEERLFKLIQEGEKAEDKDDTLVVSSEGSALKPLVFEEDVASGRLSSQEAPLAESDANTLSDAEIRGKKAARAGLFRPKAREAFSTQQFSKFLSLKILNRAMFVLFIGAIFYFVMSHGVSKKSPDQDFMQKANAMSPQAPLEVPTELFGVKVSGDQIPQRNVFQPYKAPEPIAAPVQPAVVGSPVAVDNPLDVKLAQMKLSGLYMGETPEALVEALDEKRTYAVKIGSEFKGLTVKDIKAEGIWFTNGKAEQLLK